MRSSLQYAYSISVLVGVLITAYFFMNREENYRIYMPQNSNYVIQGDLSDPAVNRLVELELALKKASTRKEQRDLTNQPFRHIKEKKFQD